MINSNFILTKQKKNINLKILTINCQKFSKIQILFSS